MNADEGRRLSDALGIEPGGKARCTVCGARGRFDQDHKSIREGFRCRKCRASLRYRHQAAVIIDELSRHRSASFAALVREPEFAALAIYEPGIIGPFRKYCRKLAGYSSSYYWDATPVGETHKGIRCEDLQALTFPDDSFDLVISSDIFEHVREPFRAFQELRRVLRPGGRHIFTVPLSWPLPEQTVARLELDGEEGDRFVLPPVYHSSPVDPQGSLVYTDFGLDLPQRLAELGFETRVYYGPRYNVTFASQVTGDRVAGPTRGVTPTRRFPRWRAMVNTRLLRKGSRTSKAPPRDGR